MKIVDCWCMKFSELKFIAGFEFKYMYKALKGDVPCSGVDIFDAVTKEPRIPVLVDPGLNGLAP